MRSKWLTLFFVLLIFFATSGLQDVPPDPKGTGTISKGKETPVKGKETQGGEEDKKSKDRDIIQRDIIQKDVPPDPTKKKPN